MPTHAHGAPRAHSAHPSSSHSWSESPSPTKKRRVDSVPLAHVGPSSARDRPHKPQSYHGSSSAASTRSPRSYTAEPVDPQLQSRLHSSTIRLRDAWDDILRRHSTPHAGPPAASSPFSRSASAAPSFPTPRRHREAGRTRAIPVEEDDIIDLGTMEIVEDRGVLRRTRAGAFSLGGYSHMLDDIIVGPDTGVGEGEEGEWSEDEEEVEDEPSGRDDGRAGDLDDESDDELGDMEELPSLPSLLYREERRRVEEQRDQLRDFWEQEARARGSHSAGLGRDEEDVSATGLSPASARGSRTVAKPPTIEEVTEDEDDVDELDFFAEAGDSSPALRRSMSSPLEVDVVTPTRERRSPSRSAPSTMAAIRHGIKHVALATPPTSRSHPSPATSRGPRLSAPPKMPSTKSTPMKLDSSPLKPNLAHGAACLVCRKRKRRCDGTQPACGPCKSLEIPCAYALQKRSHSVSPAKRSTPASRAISAPPPPKLAPPAPRPKLVPKSPASFAVRKASRPSVAHTPSSRPPLSSSPLREVITVASPSPSPSPSPAPSPSPSPSPAPQSRQRAISPELGLSTTAREQHVSGAGPSRLEHAQPYQHPTPTPTPPPFGPKHMSTAVSAASAAASAVVPQRAISQTSPGTRRHSFELVLDIKPHLPRKNLPTSGGAARAAAPSDAKGKSRARDVEERDELRKETEAGVDVRPTGLSTPPLSKRAQPAQPPRTARGRSSSASSSSSAPDAATKSSPRSACPSPAAARKRTRPAPRPSQILPRAATAAADDSPDELEVDDPLLLSSPIKTPRRAATATPAPTAVLASGGSGQGRRARGRSSGACRPRRPACAPSPPPEPPTVAPTCDLSPLHSTYLLHALLSLSFASHALAVVSYILSPAHVVVLALRVFTQWNLTNPRRNHPKRSLRFFVALWATQALVAAAAHAVTGSRGTKGPRGTYQRGIILDFVGQAVTPSLLHLLLVDLLLSLCQLTTLLLAFAATVPNDLDAASGEGARDYAILLGVDELEGDEGAFDEDEEQRASDAAGGARRRRKRRRSSASGAARQRRQSRRGCEGVPLEDTDDVEADDFDALEDEAVALGMGSFKPLASGPPSQYTRTPLIADLRLSTVWSEIRRSTRAAQAAREADEVRELEEGRV